MQTGPGFLVWGFKRLGFLGFVWLWRLGGLGFFFRVLGCKGLGCFDLELGRQELEDWFEGPLLGLKGLWA